MDSLTRLARALGERDVRFVVIGVGGANYWAHAGGVVFNTDDRDLFLPLESDNLVRAWAACEDLDYDLWLGNEPLDKPRDQWLADRIIGHIQAGSRTSQRSIVPNDAQGRARATAQAT